MIDGVKIEFFIVNINKLYELIRIKTINNASSHLTKFATCKILYEADNFINTFINYALALYQNLQISNTINDDIKFAILGIHNRIEDAEALINSDSFYSVSYLTLEKIRVIYAKIYGIIDLPATKIEKIYSNTEYAQNYIASPTHKLPNADFISLYLEYLRIDNRFLMLEKLKKLYNISFREIDFDTNNFCLKFTKQAPFIV